MGETGGNATNVVLCLATFPDAATARGIAHKLVGEGIAACVNLVPGVESIYRWQGKIEQGTEILALLKTTPGLVPALKQRIKALHPYEVPELVVLNVANGLEPYLDWIKDSVGIRPVDS